MIKRSYFGDQSSTLGSVVPLALFYIFFLCSLPSFGNSFVWEQGLILSLSFQREERKKYPERQTFALLTHRPNSITTFSDDNNKKKQKRELENYRQSNFDCRALCVEDKVGFIKESSIK